MDFVPDYMRHLGQLKFELLACGLRISSEANVLLTNVKGPLRTRSGASSGLDLVLPYDIHVNCPIEERFAQSSELVLRAIAGELVITRADEILTTVIPQRTPDYYSRKTLDGKPMIMVGQMCSGDRFCYGMTGPYCRFWRSDLRCKFCSIGLNKSRDLNQKTISQLIETLDYAIRDANLPAKHILIGGGTPSDESMGATLAAELCRVIKKNFNISCYVMIAAPLRNEYIDLLFDAGVDELGMNLEFYSEESWENIIPGKHKLIGRKRYLEALEYAVKLFGPINTRSILVAGLEDPQHTIHGSEHLASMGVMPILSAFRPLDGIDLEHRQGFDASTYFDLYLEAHTISMKYRIPTGPTCVSCQNNTLSLPLPTPEYSSYQMQGDL